MNGRIKREARTIEAMVNIFCRGECAARETPCDKCRVLLEYALERLEKCPFQEAKPTCAKCSVHCYKPSKRERIRKVMRCAGPRMIYRHPVLALFHVFDGRRKAPGRRGE